MSKVFTVFAAFVSATMLALPSAAPAQSGEVPYWVSISADQARMRTGPGLNFPISWLYQRRWLPLRVVEVYQNWRKVEDPDGTQGWMLANLLSSDRTGMIVGDVRAMRESPNEEARVRFRAEPGVVGRIRNCRRDWCEFDVRGRTGFVRMSYLYGVEEDERVR